MLTRCCICGLPLSVPDGDEDSALCAGCWRANFAGQQFPERDLPRLAQMVPMPSRRGREAMRRPWAHGREVHCPHACGGEPLSG